MHDLFTAQVERSPEAIALICDDEQLTYRELDQRSNQLANHLRTLGVGRETLVGICTARSLDMVVGMFAIFKAGGAYVPLDPAYPKERLAFILNDAQADLVLTQKEFAPLFSGQPIHMVCLDGDWRTNAQSPATEEPMEVSPENLAYVIYTSGSTGNPKGVMITHESLCNFVRLAGAVLDVTDRDVYMQTASIAYALSVRQLMIPLANGATVVLANAGQMRDPLMLFKLIKRRGITLMDMVPSFWRTCIHRLSELAEEERQDLLDNSLRRIVSIGEPLTSDISNDWAFRFGQKTQLVNIFGQTETTGVVASYPIPREAPAKEGIVPIGRSIPETKLYLLDANLKPVPVGEQGELCVSNPCLARGYLNRPDLTAEKFILNPFNDGGNSHLYRTGDLAVQREDGNIEFIGRGDHQVKIRGQRLELGEVESVLRRHAAVRECAVMARGEHADEKYLAAYIVASEKSVSSSEIRQFARTLLPEYMVPSAFVFLDAMPLTPNGKLNRLALPEPAAVGLPGSDQHREEPRNHIERTIKEIWKNLLKLDDVGIHESFFDVGGYSLLSVRMFARIERDLGVRLPYTSLFQATTIAQIAELVAGANEESTQWRIIVPVQTQGNKPPFFGIHAHQGGVLFWRDIVSHLPKDQPFYALQALGVDGLTTALNNIPDMARLYIQEMRKVQPRGPYFIGGYSLGGEIAFEMAQQLVRGGEKMGLLLMLDTRNPNRSIRPMARVSGGSLAAELDAPPPSSRSSALRQKFSGHLMRLSVLSPKQQMKYLLNQVTVRVNRSIISVIVKIYRLLRQRLPDNILLIYMRIRHSEALTNYVPAVYPGKITLFRASESLAANPDDSLLGWGPLAAGGMDVHHFSAPHEIVYGEYAKDVAAKLTECLKEAHGE